MPADETPSGGHVNDVNMGINEMIEEEHGNIHEGQAMEAAQCGPDPNARNSKSSQLPSRAHSRSPAPCSNLADNQEARRAEGAWRCLAETPLASPTFFDTSSGASTHRTEKRSLIG